MRTGFASVGLTAGQLNAIVKKLGGHDMALRFLRDELSVSESTRSWREEDGVIYLPPLITDGTTGGDWITRLESKGFCVGVYAKRVLLSPDFKPTNGVTTKVAVLKGMLFNGHNRFTKNIRVEAYFERKLSKPNAELACLILENFTDEEIKEMGLRYIVAMHEPINQHLLIAGLYDDGCCWLDAYDGMPDSVWDRDIGFAFAVSQVSSQP